MAIDVKKCRVLKKISLNWRAIFIIFVIALMILTCGRIILTSKSGIVDKGKVDLNNVDFTQNHYVVLDGNWEFYWQRLLVPKDFVSPNSQQIDSFMKVQGAWSDGKKGNKVYPQRGFATYRLLIKYPTSLSDPALKIRQVATAYKIYANGEKIVEMGKVSDKAELFKSEEKTVILELPKDKQEIELICQVANLQYAKGGFRVAPEFGSKRAFSEEQIKINFLQLIFIGISLGVGIYCLILFMHDYKNKSIMFFCLFCFFTALRCALFGDFFSIVFSNLSYDARVYINYFTGYNYIPIVLLFVSSVFSFDYHKRTLGLLLFPTLFFNLLFFMSPQFMSFFTKYVYILVMIQMIYIIFIIIKAVIHRRENAILIFIVVCVFIVTIIQSICHYIAIDSMRIEYAYLYRGLIAVSAMFFIQAKSQANINRNLILYNEKLVEESRLKDKIMETEMSFFQAQIKPHFLYNALSAIANVCEMDGGEKASNLIVDLAVYLRNSLTFNNFDKMTSIEKELEFTETYFNIEKARFGEKIQLRKEIEVPLDFKVPVLIIQPLVENAVKHGIAKKAIGGTVTLSMKIINEDLYVEVKDDGIGMESGKLELLLSEGVAEKGVGILNIQHRLIRLYGRGLELVSEVGKGTCVKFIISKVEK